MPSLGETQINYEKAKPRVKPSLKFLQGGGPQKADWKGEGASPIPSLTHLVVSFIPATEKVPDGWGQDEGLLG